MGRSLDRSCSCCTLLTCFCLLRAMVSALICIHMIPKLSALSSVCNPGAPEQHLYVHRLCARWMRSNRLQLNTAKTEVLWSTSSRRLHLLPVSPIRVGTDQVMPVSVVRKLDIYTDADVSMRSHVSKTVAACFAILRQLRSIRRSVPRSDLQSLVLQRLDYGNATVAGMPSYLTKRMQSVLNSATRLCFLHRGTTASRHS